MIGRDFFLIFCKAEAQLAAKFKAVVGDLRRSWEVCAAAMRCLWACMYVYMCDVCPRQEEEAGRSLQLEERLRSHYSVVLEHMEAQLKMVGGYCKQRDILANSWHAPPALSPAGAAAAGRRRQALAGGRCCVHKSVRPSVRPSVRQ